MKRNVPIFGFIIGIFLPVVGLIIVYFAMGGYSNGFMDFINSMTRSRSEAALILTLSLLINIAPFIYFTNKRLDYSARGILVATVLYATLIILIKYVW